MAKNKNLSYNDIPDKNEDWGLDPRNGFKYSGESVQKFIKETFDSKMGYFHYDTSSNRYLVFADEASKNEYVENPTLTDLVLGSFDAPFNYEASITMLTPSYNAVFLGSNGNYLDFTFDVKNKAGNSTGENVTVTYTFIRNATKKVLTETRRYGETVHFNIDDYLLEGTNTIIVGISGQTTLAATTAALTYQVVNLSYSDEMNIARVYDLSQGAYTMEVFFNVSGYGTKIVEWFLDGNQLEFVKSEDEVVDVTAQRTKYIELSNLTSGIHTIQSRAYTLVNGEKFYTDTLYREIMVNNGDTTANVVAVAANVPHSHGIVTGSNPFLFYGAEQYIPYEIRFATRKTGNVSVYLGGELAGTLTSSANTESRYSVTSNKAGTLSVKFSVDGVEREIPLSVNQTSLNIEEIKTSLSFDFRATGKSNTSVDKDVWSYGDYTATFEGFNWNASSGWVDNSLLINNGASFSVDIAPLAKDATSTGKTLEFEFSTRNVENDDAVICDLTTNGKGLLITASEARLTSAAGEVVSTRFKAGEVNRIAFVINRKTGVTYKGLVFIYVNGVLSGAVNYGSADNFTSTKQLTFVGTEDAQVELRAMRFYDTALSFDNVLNNYILYRDTLNEMMEVYYRNEIYAEGTQTFSPDAMLHRLPVMVITGDIPTLEAATSTSTQILVDIDYTNEQDPTKNFKMKNAALRIQGTSSLAYPRKNFRFYTQKEESTLVYDANGKIIQNKLYSFKDGAQPVDCWCLKADFAESSGTHNTAIARLWNKAMYGAIIQHKNVLGEEVNGYALRTNAQIAALNAGYEYDVRTTIDGFPIVLFYKKNASDTDLIFLGKYNFNNDKSTPSVFGFENIPDFDNSRMQCWETKDNGHPLGLFTDVSRFDADWSEAFESRYPDTKTPNTADLKAFSVWMNGVSQSDFITQKWAHFDVYKVAAYYCYLMRFGAVDQPVKNAFITSEDGEKFYFINYDNDTINGLINTGRLALDPTVNRDTIGSDGEYVYAGHNSVLWNRFTNDAEFMEIVSIVDNALYSAGLRYDEVIAEFNEGQADKWVERVYNQDAEYKYLLPYVNQATNNLFMLQGARSSHRSWWLSKRFSLYDSLFLSGAYRDRNISFKCLNDTQPNQEFTITAATKMNYGYGVNNGVRETGVEVDKGGTHTFVTTDTLNLGDVVKVFASANIEALDLSKLADRLAVLDCSAAADPSLGTKMKRLILGGYIYFNPNNVWQPVLKVNTELAAISGINVLTSLQELNVEGYQNMTTLNLTAQKDLRKVFAKGSSVASIDFAAGAPVEHLELPSAMMALNFNQLPYLTFDNLVFESGLANIHSLNIYGCPNLTNDFSFVQRWLEEKTAIDSSCTIAMDNVDWVSSYEDFLAFSQHKANGMKVELKGKVYLDSLNLDQANEFIAIWGEEVFDKKSDFRITAPDALYINPSEVTLNEGESVKFTYILFSDSEGSVTYKIASGSREGVTLDENTGVLTTTENGANNATIYVRAIYTSNEGNTTYATATVLVKKRIYPTSASLTINGASTIAKDETYTWSSSTADVNGDMNAEWSLSGDAANEYISLGTNNVDSCVVKFHKAADMGESVNGTLTLTLKKKVDGSVVATETFNVTMAVLSYPTESNTTINGDKQPEGNNPTYTWESTATGTIGAIRVEWSLDDALKPYYEIQSQEYDVENPLQGSVTLTKIMDVEAYMSGNINLTITRVSSGLSFTISKELSILNPSVIMTDKTNPAVLSVMYNKGLCANANYMTKQEAEAVKDGTFNPSGSQTGSIFYNNTNITSFDEFRYFTGMTTLDAYAFYECTKMASLKVPPTVTKFGTYCCFRNSASYVELTIDSIDVETVASYAFCSYSTSNSGHININNVNWYSTQTHGSANNYAFYNTSIQQLNVYAAGEGHNSTNTNYRSYKMFNECSIQKIYIDENMTRIPKYFFYSAYIYGIEIPDSITEIATYALSVRNGEGFNVNRMSNSITTLGASAFQRAIFKTDVCLNNLKFSTYDPGTSNIQYSTYEKKLDLSENQNGGSNLYLVGFLYSFNSCANFVLPTRALTYYYYSYTTKISKLSIPSIKNFCSSTFNGSGSPATYAESLYTKDLNTGEYVQVTDFNPSNWGISSIPSYAFYGCKAITGYDATSINDHNTYVFYNSGIKTLKLDNFNGSGTIAAYAFANCALLETITDMSTQPWATLTANAFNGVNANVTINSQVFGLYKQSSGFTLSPMESGVVSALAFGDYTFTAPSGAAFGDGTTSKTITLGAGNKIQDLTDVLKIEYLTLVISSNLDGAQFKLTYTSSDGTAKEDVVSAGTHLLKVTKGTTVKVEASEAPKGWTAPAASTVTMSSTSNSVTMDFAEEILVYIADTSGNLYTESEWTASGKSNDQAEGVCVMRTKSGGFIIAKEDASSSTIYWGGYGKVINGIVTTTTKNDAFLDMDGIDNTYKIIEQLSGYTDSKGTVGAPAAEACVAFTFPSGQKGYLSSLGEWDLACSQKDAITASMSLIGGTAVLENTYWSSTQYNNNYSWRFGWNNRSAGQNYKSSRFYVRAFAPIGRLTINSTLATKFTLSYTNNYGDVVTEKVSQGSYNLNVKNGTQVTVTPDAIGNITAEPQTFTWQGFTHECNFVFAKDAGVYIQHVNGALYTESEWTACGYANSDANGVAILSETIPAFVIAKTDADSSKLQWGGYNKTITGIVTTTTKTTALLDYDGIGNTPKIIEQCVGYTSNFVTGAPAAEACAAFTFPSGTKGYLPALGEWQVANNNKTAVVSAMMLIGGTAISTIDYYWSSTQYDSIRSWYMYLSGGGFLDTSNKDYKGYVRAFATL